MVHSLDAEKMYAVVNNSEDTEFIKKNLPDKTYLSLSREGLAMIMQQDATKSKAVAAVAEFWDIKQSEIVAFGDDMNDMDLLKYCGVSVAMANAVSEIKTAADYICDGNDNDGVAKWLTGNVLKHYTSN